jgi:hypothetical protein
MRQPFPLTALALSVASALTVLAAHAQPLTDAFTYQGRLSSDAQPLTTPTTVRFRLFDAPAGGLQIGPAITTTVTPDASGVFSLPLDFGPVFGPEARYLEIALPNPAAPSQFIPLTPRTPITPAPIAHFARTAPTQTLAQVTGGVLSQPPGAPIDLAADKSFLSGLRLFDGVDRALTLSLPGLQSNLDLAINTTETLKLESASDFSIRSGNAGVTLEAPTGVSLFSGVTKLLVTSTKIDLDSAATLDLSGVVVNVDATGILDIGAGLVQISSGSTIVNGLMNINGQVTISNTLQVSSNLLVGGEGFKPGGGMWGSLSDARFKHNIHPLSGSLATVRALRPVSFEYTKDHPLAAPGSFHGFIAQEVRTIRPDWITTDEHGVLLLTPQGFDALVVNALQELDAEHQREINTLRAHNARLEDRLDALEHTLQLLSEKSN